MKLVPPCSRLPLAPERWSPGQSVGTWFLWLLELFSLQGVQIQPKPSQSSFNDTVGEHGEDRKI